MKEKIKQRGWVTAEKEGTVSTLTFVNFSHDGMLDLLREDLFSKCFQLSSLELVGTPLDFSRIYTRLLACKLD